jgi:MarR family transcriptional regulator, organic hydroperoxide resistance regulator
MSTARDERFYFHLQIAAARLRGAADRRCIERAGITSAQAAALAVIHEHPGVSQRMLARTLHQTEPSITTLVRRLIAADLIDRTVDRSDARTRELALTDHGTTALRSAERAFAAVNRHIDDLLTSVEIRHVTDALRRVTETGIAGSGRRPGRAASQASS